jgi:iron complex outermembrane receptor protein
MVPHICTSVRVTVVDKTSKPALLSSSARMMVSKNQNLKGRRPMGNPVGKRLLGMIMCALILTAFGGLSFAQETPAEEQPGIEEETMEIPVAVGEITVTAQKREEDIQDVPVSVSVLRGEDLDIITTGGADVRALSARVPSLIMESSFGRAFPRFYIRGLGNTEFDLTASQPVSLVVEVGVL